MSTITRNVLISLPLLAMPNLCFAASAASTGNSIGKALGMALFGYIVLKVVNRKKK